MKEKMKFIVMVFGVTLAIFGSMTTKASEARAADVRCGNGTMACAKLQSGHVVKGVRFEEDPTQN